MPVLQHFNRLREKKMDGEEEEKTSLPTALVRIAVAVNLGAVLLGIMFSVWGLTIDRGGPLIGVLVFQLIALLAILFAVIVHIRGMDADSPFCPRFYS